MNRFVLSVNLRFKLSVVVFIDKNSSLNALLTSGYLHFAAYFVSSDVHVVLEWWCDLTRHCSNATC